jgi:ABC-type polysaccharide/polyol phosphate transport system ATPase subunit
VVKHFPRIIAGTLAPTSGSVVVDARITALLEFGSGFNPESTGSRSSKLENDWTLRARSLALFQHWNLHRG